MNTLENNWKFAVSEDSIAGVNDSGIENFQKDPYYYLARETLQNSNDARIKGSDLPVRVVFQSYELPMSEFPDLKGFKENAERIHTLWFDRATREEEREFSRKLDEILAKKQIKCLRVSDYNTTGIIGYGTNIVNNNWDSLIRGEGLSSKNSGNGGSKGIGKNASFAVSDLHTVMYSTFTEEGLHLTTGIAKLISGDHDGSNAVCRSGKGFFRNHSGEHAEPVKETVSYQPGYVREDVTGADLFILGITDSDTYKREIVSTILESYMYAIIKGTLIVEVDGLVIDKDSIEALLKDENNFINEDVKQRVLGIYSVITTMDSCKKITIENLGNKGQDIELFLKPVTGDEPCSNSVVCFRNPWFKTKEYVITNAFVRYSGILVLDNGPLNDYLRKLENAKHDDWEPSRSKNELEKKAAQKILKDLKNQIRQAVSDLANDIVIDDDSLEDGGSLGATAEKNRGAETKGGEGLPSKRATIGKPKKKKPVKPDPKKESIPDEDGDETNDLEDIGGSDGSGSGDAKTPHGSNKGKGTKHNPGQEDGNPTDGNNKINVVTPILSMNSRIFTRGQNGQYRLTFTPDIDIEEIEINITKLGVVGSGDTVEVKSATAVSGIASCTVEDNVIKASNIVKDTKVIIDLELTLDRLYTMGVAFNGKTK